MQTPRLYLYDDPVAREWHPFSLTRPAGELLFGTETLRARSERVFGMRCHRYLAGERLVGFGEPDAPPCTTLEQLAPGGPRLFINSRFVPGGENFQVAADGSVLPAAGGSAPRAAGGPVLLVSGSETVGAWMPGGTAPPPALLTGDPPADWPEHSVSGRLLGTVWELMAENPERIRMDGSRLEETPVAAHVHSIGSGRIAAAADALVEPGVIIDTSRGPVVLASGSRVRGPARIEGPLYLGPNSVILGGVVGSSSIGPRCRVRGEVQACVVLGFSNKAHDGYLGHSVVGRWVNLGAMTSNSDLKNNYSPVRLPVGGRRIATGILKAGCLLGDHVRTGIGTALNTGTVVGTGSNLFGGGMPPRDVPPFSWCSGGELAEYDLERFLNTAETVMARRDVRLGDGMRSVYRRAFELSAHERAAGGRG